MPLILGLDASTQSLSAVILDTDAGVIRHQSSVHFGRDLPGYGQPSGFLPGGEDGVVHSDPGMWLDALDLVFARMRDGGAELGSVVAISGAAQQHGSVYLRGGFATAVARLDPARNLKKQLCGQLSRATSPIWMDTSTADECAEIATAAGGDAEVRARSGSVTTPRFTGPQIRRFAKSDPEAYGETATIHLVSSFLASVLAGRSVAIDHGDGAGMNLMSLAGLCWDAVLVEATAPGLLGKLPPLARSAEVAGRISPYFCARYGLPAKCQVLLFSGDNPCSLVGTGAARPDRLVISLGTSDTIFAAMPEPRTDPQGFGHVFGNPLGGFMSLICVKNGSLAREKVKERFGLSWDDFGVESLASTPPGNAGRLMLPFYGPEITPRLDTDAPVFAGDWAAGEPEPAAVVRALLEGQLLNLKVHSRWLGIRPDTILLTGGASVGEGIARMAADVFGIPVSRLSAPGSAAVGAAMRAGHAIGKVALDALEDAFCRPLTGATWQPDPASGRTYDALEAAWLAALRNAFPAGGTRSAG